MRHSASSDSPSRPARSRCAGRRATRTTSSGCTWSSSGWPSRRVPVGPEHGLHGAGERGHRAVGGGRWRSGRTRSGRSTAGGCAPPARRAGAPRRCRSGPSARGRRRRAAPRAGARRRPPPAAAAPTTAASTPTGMRSRSTTQTQAKGTSSARSRSPAPRQARAADTTKSTPNCAAVASAISAAHAVQSCGRPTTPTITAGASENHESAVAKSRRRGGAVRRRTAGSWAATWATPTASGTAPAGSSTSMGARTSCTGRVQPSPTSNSTRTRRAQISVSQAVSAGLATAPSRAAQAAAAATTNPAPTSDSMRNSRRAAVAALLRSRARAASSMPAVVAPSRPTARCRPSSAIPSMSVCGPDS